jgi:hypothetical protein
VLHTLPLILLSAEEGKYFAFALLCYRRSRRFRPAFGPQRPEEAFRMAAALHRYDGPSPADQELEEGKQLMANVERSIVGELINFRGMLYAPLNENGVFLLFGKVAEDLNMYVEEIRPEAPDAIVRRFMGKGWERLRVEFEYRSSEYRQQGEDGDLCDAIVCWEHDWADCPVEVIELRDRIREMENHPIHRPTNRRRQTAKPRDGSSLTGRTARPCSPLCGTRAVPDETCFTSWCVSSASAQRAFQRVPANMLILWSSAMSPGREPIRQRSRQKWGWLSVADQTDCSRSSGWRSSQKNHVATEGTAAPPGVNP